MKSTIEYDELHKLEFNFFPTSLEKYLPEKGVKETITLKTPRSEKLDPIKKLDYYLQKFLKQKKRPQDIAMTVQEKVLSIMGPLSILWVMVEVNSGSSSSSTVEKWILYLNF